MKEKIKSVDIGFKGSTKIELFDNQTGEKVQVVKKDNLYNYRIPWLNYLNTVMKCNSAFLKTNIADYIFLTRDGGSSKRFTMKELLTATSGNDYSILNMYNTLYCNDYTSASNQRSDRYNLFSTLILTNKTLDASSHGEFNGLPVAMCNSGVASTNYMMSHPLIGQINMEESSYDNTKLHLVFDFNTSKANVEFDSIWFMPSNTVSYSNGVTNRGYEPVMLYDKSRLCVSSKIVPYDNQLTGTVYTCDAGIVNDGMRVIYSTENTDRDSRLLSVTVCNYEQGIIKTCNLNALNKTDYIRNLGTPIYYDSQNSILYCYSHGRTGYNFAYDNYSDYKNKNSADQEHFYSLDMNSGEVTDMGLLVDKIIFDESLKFEGITSKDSVKLRFFYTDNNIYFMLQFAGSTPLNWCIYNVYKFEVNNNSPEIKQITNLKLYGNYIEHDSTSRNFIDYSGRYFYLYGSMDKNYSKDRTHRICIDLENKKIIDDNVLQMETDTYGYFPSFTSSIFEDVSKYVCNSPTYKKYFEFESFNGSYTSSRISKLGFNQIYFLPTPWTTHNKLNKPIIKDENKTMKITYDIIWDKSLDDIIDLLL